MYKRIFVYLVLMLFQIGYTHAQRYSLGDVVTNADGSQGIVFYINPEQNGGWIVALTDASTGCQWGTSNDIPNLQNHDISIGLSNMLLEELDGYANTQTIRTYHNNNSSYAAGTVDFNHGWYLPSAGQMRILVSKLFFLESVFNTVGGLVLKEIIIIGQVLRSVLLKRGILAATHGEAFLQEAIKPTIMQFEPSMISQ